MAKYYFEDREITMTDPIIVKHGACGGNFVNDVSVGGFYCDIKLTTPNAGHRFRLSSPVDQPTNMADVADITTWVQEQLDLQYLVPEE